MNLAILSRRLRVGALVPLVLAFGLAVHLLPTHAQSNRQAAKFYEDALVRYEKKDLPGAIIQLKNALQVDPNMLPVQLLLGKILMQSGEVAAAEVALAEALRLGVSRAEVVVMLAQTYLAQGKHREVFEQSTFNPAGLPPPVQQRLFLLRATALIDLGDSRGAMRAIDEARAIDDRAPETWLTEIPIRIRARQFREAGIAVERALALAPNSAEAWYQKGAVAHVQGGLKDALAAYDRVLTLDTAHTEARVSRIGILIDQGRLADAAKDVADLRKLSPREPRGAYLSALLAERDGKPDVAAAALKEVTEFLDPVPQQYIRFRPQLLMLNGLAHFGLNQFEKAKLNLELLQRVQGNSPATKILARLYLRDNNPAVAANVLEGYLRVQPGDGQALTLLARAYTALGRHSKATALMQEAVNKQDSPSFRTALGMTLLGGGREASSLSELEAAFKRDPGQIQAGTALVQLYLQSGQPRKAVAVADSLARQRPADPMVLNLQGMAQGQAGNLSAARTTFEKAIQLRPDFTAAKINLARLEVAAKAVDAASNRLNEILKREPANGEAMNELARIAERKGQQAEAQRLLERARDVAGPRELRWGLALVDFHLRYGRASAALEAAKQASAKSPEDLATQLIYARTQLAVGDTVSAKSVLAGATRFADRNPVRLAEIADLQLAANDPAGAVYTLTKALDTAPGYLPALAILTTAELRLGEIPKAEKRARDIVTQNPRLAIGHTLLGDVAAAKGQVDPAIAAYRQAHQLEPSTSSLLRLFGALTQRDGGKPAVQTAEQWLKSRPRDLQVRKALADFSASAGNFSLARQHYEASLKIDPDDAEVLNNLANVQMRLKDPAAVKTAEMALAKAPGNPLATDTLGWALFLNGQADRALPLLRDARLRLPGNPEIRYHLAAVLAKLGRNTEAREELEVALKSGLRFEGQTEAEELRRSMK